MNTTPRLFIYEVRRRTGPVAHEFYCYAVYDSKIHHIIQQFSSDTQRAARRLCEDFIGTITYTDDAPIVVWRNWPVLLEEVNDQLMVEEIRKREVLS